MVRSLLPRSGATTTGAMDRVDQSASPGRCSRGYAADGNESVVARSRSPVSEPRVTEKKVFRAGNGRVYHCKECHHLKRTRNQFLRLCSCVEMSGWDRNDLYVCEDETLHASVRCSRYRPIWGRDGRVYYRVLGACSQCV